MIKKPFVIKNPVCKRCWCCRAAVGLACLGTSICEGQDARGFHAAWRRKLISHRHASCLPHANTSRISPDFTLPLLPTPNTCFPSDILLSPACSHSSFVFSSDSLHSALCWTIGPKLPEAEQKGWSRQESCSWDCGQMKHRIHCNANRGEKARIHWPISIYCLRDYCWKQLDSSVVETAVNRVYFGACLCSVICFERSNT